MMNRKGATGREIVEAAREEKPEIAEKIEELMKARQMETWNEASEDFECFECGLDMFYDESEGEYYCAMCE
jgi:hypothetical protein